MSHNDATVLLRAIQRKLGRTITIHDIPKAVQTSARMLDVEKALKMVAAEILASVERCEAEENAGNDERRSLYAPSTDRADAGTATASK